MLALAERHPNLYATVGVHPDYPDEGEVRAEDLIRLADHPKILAIGETGLDYYRLSGDLEWQRQRFAPTSAPRGPAASRSSSTRAQQPRTRSGSCARRAPARPGG